MTPAPGRLRAFFVDLLLSEIRSRKCTSLVLSTSNKRELALVWYFVAGAVFNVLVTLWRMRLIILQGGAPHWASGLLFSAAIGAAIYGTIFWLISLAF